MVPCQAPHQRMTARAVGGPLALVLALALLAKASAGLGPCGVMLVVPALAWAGGRIGARVVSACGPWRFDASASEHRRYLKFRASMCVAIAGMIAVTVVGGFDLGRGPAGFGSGTARLQSVLVGAFLGVALYAVCQKAWRDPLEFSLGVPATPLPLDAVGEPVFRIHDVQRFEETQTTVVGVALAEVRDGQTLLAPLGDCVVAMRVVHHVRESVATETPRTVTQGEVGGDRRELTLALNPRLSPELARWVTSPTLHSVSDSWLRSRYRTEGSRLHG